MKVTLDWRRLIPILSSYLTVAVMMTCVTFSILGIGARLVPEWNGAYLLPLSFLVALEAQISRRGLREVNLLSVEWLQHRLSEWVVILVAVKALLYLIHGPAQFLIDAVIWQKDFFGNFFDSEYLAAILIVFVVWLLAGIYAEMLLNLEEDPERLALERQGTAVMDRAHIRDQITALTFGIGTLMLAAAALVRLDLQTRHLDIPAKPASLVNLIIYFVLGISLLSQSQFALLRSRWTLEELPASAQIGPRWILVGLGILLALAGVAVLLPTNYSLNLLDVLGVVVIVVVSIINLLALVLILPFLLIFNWLASLFGNARTTATPPQLPPVNLAPNLAVPNPMLELLKSFLFWTLFFTVIFFSIRHYLRQHETLWRGAREVPLLRWLVQVWQWILARLAGMRALAEEGLAVGAQRLRGLRGARRARATVYRAPAAGGLAPRDQVIAVYLAMLRHNGERGLPRRPAQTPAEYAHVLHAELPDEGGAISDLTGAFEDARYSRHPVAPAQAQLVRRLWGRLRRALHASRDRSRRP